MTRVMTHMCISHDGFVAQPDDNPAELFDEYRNGDVVVPSLEDPVVIQGRRAIHLRSPVRR